MKTTHNPSSLKTVDRVLPKRRIKQEISGTEVGKKQEDRTTKLGDPRKLSNAGNRDEDDIKQNNSDTSSCENVHDTVKEFVQAAKCALWGNEY